MNPGSDPIPDSIEKSPGSFAVHPLVGSMAMYQTLVDSLPLCLLIKAADGRRMFANQAYLQYRGCRLEDILGRYDHELFPAEIADRFTADDRRVMATGESCHGVEESQAPDGSVRWIERFKCPLLDEQGHVHGVQLLFWDITAKVLAERTRDRERQLLQTLLDNMPDSIYFKDKDSRFIRVSAGMAHKFGLRSSDEVIGLSDAEIFTPEHASTARNDEVRIMETGIPLVSRVEKETWPDRDDTWCSSTKLPLRDADGNVIGTFGISRDITDLKHTEEELAKARDAADQANRAKSDFLANMSHEIRTPMNAIIGMSELLARTSLSRDQRDFLDLVREAADSLLRLLNDILDFSKIEASKLELEQIPFSLRECIGKTGQTLSLRAAEQGLELACRVSPDVPDRLIGDPGRLRQILINLIGNAIKFTERGEVFVDVTRDPQTTHEPSDSSATSSAKRLRLLFSVRDTGIGIPKEKQASVLEAFTQADSSTTRRYGGTGLGLTISAQLAQLMGGHLWLESEVGVGTTFYFNVNVEVAPSQCIETAGAINNLDGLRVLVVDDNATNRRILQEMLTAWGLRPVLVPGSKEAMAELMRADEADQPYRLGVLDCMMPDLDGFGLSEWIRNRFSLDQMRLIILSSAARVGDSERCERVGISRYLTKPVIQSELLDAILQVMNVSQSVAPVTDFTPIVPCRPLRILLAEDGLANKIVAKGLLEAGGHEVVIADDGRAAIERWESDSFDMILMDMHMPEVDGIQATMEIRRREQITRRGPIPIIAITAAAMPEDARQCLQSGMNAFLAKPLQPELLYETLAKFSKWKTEVTGHEGVATFLGDEDTESSTPAARFTSLGKSVSPEVMNLDDAIKRIPGGIKGLRRLCEVFHIECDQLLDVMADAIERGDMDEVRRASHTIKGSSKLFSATRVSAVAFEIEQSAKDQQLGEAPRLFSILKSEIAELRAALQLHLGQFQDK
jgi:two-component system, sensor histidine kinase and response regulator